MKRGIKREERLVRAVLLNECAVVDFGKVDTDNSNN